MTSSRSFKNILVTGGAGFIGSNLIRVLLTKSDFTGRIINLDKLTYAGNASSLDDVASQFPSRYVFKQGDICDREFVDSLFKEYDIDSVCHLAAESHVDRSIEGPEAFITTNVNGTFTLLDVARKAWDGSYDGKLFHHVSTDEVYGSLGDTGYFFEDTPYDPRSPYSASKASSDHLVMAYYHTYGMPITMTNCSNNYGPYQFPEKLIPVMIENMLQGKALPVYGDGKNIRDWLYVEDHNSAVWAVMQGGRLGETYNIGGENEWENIKLVHTLCDVVADEAGLDASSLKGLISYVKDRPGHDQRYAINCDKLKNELGWKQSLDFEEGLQKTVRWYLDNRKWIENITSGEYLKWMEKNYKGR
ncbi:MULTISPECIES: dTDP-glucose 4,6-dehydratase [unclassified Oceanispirochaeta]|uniref:dTDP-glucose 4,6-dehydratase n=1 Tax=unclassified Oceanispirochaeta TaxID=2635722 RepID=UPI000E09C632|nr:MULTISPECIES: dTDP-glucose 4,6-dehydratase [unclassified Oceanispirochaeta]MBF9017762.1 dTDP-glucose 4,6-dehydratase [Oceanispirochaeta sp. M2]NPD74326.1 dTDP-glucose 4,6-dehydratase [Oceanispirochaeta sp. M1]RDG29806.1 dTDP-glucose 4,6-dehydratase [Oceanispirochaeta sp. M1]